MTIKKDRITGQVGNSHNLSHDIPVHPVTVVNPFDDGVAGLYPPP